MTFIEGSGNDKKHTQCGLSVVSKSILLWPTALLCTQDAALCCWHCLMYSISWKKKFSTSIWGCMIVCKPDKHTEDISYASPAANPRPPGTVPTDSRDEEPHTLTVRHTGEWEKWLTKSVNAIHLRLLGKRKSLHGRQSLRILCLWFHASLIYIIIVQRDATQSSLFIILQVHSTCFGCQPYPSSGARKTVTTTSDTGHIFCAISFQCGQAWPRWREVAAQEI